MLPIASFAQLQGQAKIDSLLKELPRLKEDTNKVKLLNNLSSAYYSINPDEGIKFGQQGLYLSVKLEWAKGIAYANYSMGNNYFVKSAYPKALECYFTALKIFEKTRNISSMGKTLSNIGNVYNYQCDYPKALEYYFKHLKIAQEIKDKRSIANVTANIGTVYGRQNDYSRALEYYFNALKMDEEIGDKKLIAVATGNIGDLFQSQNDYSKALEYDFRSLKIHEEIGDKDGIAYNTICIGTVYDNQKNYPKALDFFLNALKIYEETGDKDGIAKVTGCIGTVYAEQKNYLQAIEYEQKALKIAEDIGSKQIVADQLANIGKAYLSLVTDTAVKQSLKAIYPDKVISVHKISEGKYLPVNIDIPAAKAARLLKAIDYMQRSLKVSKDIHYVGVIQLCYENLSEAFRLKGDYKLAMEYADSNKVIKDSVFSEANREKIAKLENDRKKYGDSLKTAAAQRVADIKAQHRRNYEYIGVGVIVLLLGFTFLVTRNNKLLSKERKRSDNLLLNILPEEVADQLKDTGKSAAKQFDDVTVLFTDFVNFTEAGERMSPQALIEELDNCFKKFDEITGKYNVEKIKTIGYAYLAVAGLPTPDPKHAENVVRAAIEINSFMQDRLAKLGNSTFEIRIGIHSGSVVAGIVGVKKFAYDIWGDTVNTAARMEQNSEGGRINISAATYELVKDKFACEYRGEIEAKGKGKLGMYFVDSPKV